GPRQNPRYITGTIITQALEREQIELGSLDPLRDFCFCTDGVRGHLTVAAHGIPGDVYVYGQGENISMADWAALILRVGEGAGFAVVVAATGVAGYAAGSPLSAPGGWETALKVGVFGSFVAYALGLWWLARRPVRAAPVLALVVAIQLTPLAGPLLLSRDPLV